MTGRERFADMLDELRWILEVNDLTTFISTVVVIAIVVISLTQRKKVKTFFQLVGIVFFLFVGYSISPVFLFGVLGAVAIICICQKLDIPIGIILVAVTVIVAIVLAFRNVFGG